MPRKKKNPVQKVPGGWRAVVRGRIGPVRASRRDAESDAEQRNPKKKRPSRKQKMKRKQRKPNAGMGTLFDFHGTFNEKSAAMAKEAKVPGSFIKTMWFKSGPRYAVVTRHANPFRDLSGKRPRHHHVCPTCGERFLCNDKNCPFRAGAPVQDGSHTKAAIEAGPFKSMREAQEWEFKRRSPHLVKNSSKRKRKNAKISISGSKRYLKYLAKHLQKEHPKTKGKIRQNAKRKVRHSRGNPGSATELYTRFHGRGPSKVKTFLVPSSDPYAEHPELAQLGKLVSLVVGEGMKLSGSQGNDVERVPDAEKSWIRQIDFSEREAPDVTAEPNGRQIYFVGGNQALTDDALRSLGADPRKDLIDLGFCYRIEYFTRKKFDNFQPVTYWHLLGEESGVSPRLMYDRPRKALCLAGGEYIVKPEGIVN